MKAFLSSWSGIVGNVTSFLEAQLPQAVDWLITERCQLLCPHCHSRDVLLSKPFLNFGERFRYAEQMNLAELLARHPLIKGVSFCGGEPLIENGILDIFSVIKNARKKIAVSTNGLVFLVGSYDTFFVTIRKNSGEETKVPLNAFLSYVDQIDFSFDTIKDNDYRGSFPNSMSKIVLAIKTHQQKDTAIKIRTCISAINQNVIVSELVPAMNKIAKELKETGNERNINWTLTFYRPNVNAPQMRKYLEIDYTKYKEIVSSVKNELYPYDSTIKISDHQLRQTGHCPIVLPNGVLVTNIEEVERDNISQIHLGIIGYLGAENPWVIQEGIQLIQPQRWIEELLS